MIAVMNAALTHPGVASLADPLFACGGKRVKYMNYWQLFYDILNCFFLSIKCVMSQASK